jgi:MFS family permease
LPPKYAGLLLVVQPLVQAILAPIAGRLADSYPPAYIATIGMGFCTVGLFMAGTIDAGTSLTLILIIFGLLGLSLGLFATPNMTAIMECVQPRHVANASSMVATMRSTGILASATVIAVILSYFMGNQQITNENLGAFMKSMHTSLYFFSAMSLVGTFFSMVKGRLATTISTKQHR